MPSRLRVAPFDSPVLSRVSRLTCSSWDPTSPSARQRRRATRRTPLDQLGQLRDCRKVDDDASDHLSPARHPLSTPAPPLPSRLPDARDGSTPGATRRWHQLFDHLSFRKPDRSRAGRSALHRLAYSVFQASQSQSLRNLLAAACPLSNSLSLSAWVRWKSVAL